MEIVKFNFPKLLARLTDTFAIVWDEEPGPDTHCGLDYYYRNRDTGHEAYINVDQEYVDISIDGFCVYGGILEEDREFEDCIEIT